MKTVHCIKVCVLKANISAEIQERNRSIRVGVTEKSSLRRSEELGFNAQSVGTEQVKENKKTLEGQCKSVMTDVLKEEGRIKPSSHKIYWGQGIKR